MKHKMLNIITSIFFKDYSKNRLTLALASTLAPFLNNILMISVWLARAAKCRGVSPLTVGTSGFDPF